MELNTMVGERLRKIRGKRTQKKFVDEMDLIKGLSRSSYSMIEIGKRQAQLNLLDMVCCHEKVSCDYIMGIVDTRVTIDDKYVELLDTWYRANEKQKQKILKNAKKIVNGGN